MISRDSDAEWEQLRTGSRMAAAMLFSCSQLVSLFLGMSAGSVPVKSMFSVTGLICSSRRSRLSHDTLHKICFLHDNFDFIVENVETYDD